MAEILNKLLRLRKRSRLPEVPPGQRVYAIGDVHGRLDLFSALVQAVERDDRARGLSDTTVILLGDLVDRGPNSARVLGSARAWGKARKLRFLSGNHEDMFLLSFYKVSALKSFLRFGGRETLASYGLDPDAIEAMPFEQVQRCMAEAVPRQDREFMSRFETMVTAGDYLFVHAGIRPRVPLPRQSGRDCRWIREPFLSFDGDFGHCVVHGHTVTDEVDMRHNRIGIDTGAYMSGRLTALGLEGTDRWIIQTEGEAGSVRTWQSSLMEEMADQAMPGSL